MNGYTSTLPTTNGQTRTERAEIDNGRPKYSSDGRVVYPRPDPRTLYPRDAPWLQYNNQGSVDPALQYYLHQQQRPYGPINPSTQPYLQQQLPYRPAVTSPFSNDPRNGDGSVRRSTPESAVRVPASRRQSSGENIDSETLVSSFKVRKANFFKVGKVFHVAWVEPVGTTSLSAPASTVTSSSDRSLSIGRYGESVYSKVRRFIVIREGSSYCTALPIVTYGKQGVAKRGIVKSEHAIIHTTKTAPEPQQDELPARGEGGMRHPIRVIPDDVCDVLDPMSRLDFGKAHTIHHNVKVKSFGMAHEKSKTPLISTFAQVWTQSLAANPHAPKDLLLSTESKATQRQLPSGTSSRQHTSIPASQSNGGARGKMLQSRRMPGAEEESEEDEEDEEDDDDDSDDENDEEIEDEDDSDG